MALARAIVNRPKVLLLDEPMSALDRKLREEMQLELKLLQRQLGITFIFVTHDQAEAMSMSDRIVVMLDGKIQQVGTRRGDLHQPRQHPSWPGSSASRTSSPARWPRTAWWRRPTANCWPTRRHDGPAGSQVLAAVRAEAISVHSEQPAHEVNVVAGTVGVVSFLGDVIQYQITTASGHELLARTPPRQGVLPAAGSRCGAAGHPQHVQVFPNPHPSAGA